MKKSVQELRVHYSEIIDVYSAIFAASDKQYDNTKPLDRARKAIELLDAGCNDFKEVRWGFQVDGIIIAAQRWKYKYFGNPTWYYYESIPNLLAKIGYSPGLSRKDIIEQDIQLLEDMGVIC